MEGLLYIAAIIVAVAFAVLVVFLAMTLRASQRTLNNVADTLENLEKQVEGITTETTDLLKKTNQLAEDAQNKSAKLNGVFDGIKGIGETTKEFSDSLGNITRNISRTASESEEKASQALTWGSALLDLWKKKK